MKRVSGSKSFLIVACLGLFFAMVLLTSCVPYGKAKTNEPASQTTQQAQPEPQAQPEATAAPATQHALVKVYITPAGFNPETVVVKPGDTVKWVNTDSAPHWPASAMHPTHNDYPEPGGCIGSKFDACKGLAFGEKYDLIFNITGTWAYHDHLNPTVYGKVIVQ